MNGRSHLIPEKRRDRKGNLVTRWVSTFRKTVPVTLIPAPLVSEDQYASQLPYHLYNKYLEQNRLDDPYSTDYSSHETHRYISRDEVRELAESLEQEIEQAKLALFPSPSRSSQHNRVRSRITDTRDILGANLSFLIRYSPETLDKVIASSKLGTKEYLYWQNSLKTKTLSPGENSKETKSSIDYLLSRYQRMLLTVESLRRFKDHGVELEQDGHPVSIAEFVSIVDTILPRNRQEAQCSDESIHAAALFAYISGAHEEFMFVTNNISSSIYRDHKEDLDYLADNLDGVYPVLTELGRRKITDRGFVKMIIESPAVALVDGEL